MMEAWPPESTPMLGRVAAVDWIELVELVHRFTWAVDHSEWQLLSQVLLDPVFFDASTVTGRPARSSTPDELISMFQGNVSYVGMQHLVGNQLVSVSEDRTHARVRAYSQVTLVVSGVDQPVMRNGVCYLFEASASEGHWKIRAIHVFFEFGETNVSAPPIAERHREVQP